MKKLLLLSIGICFLQIVHSQTESYKRSSMAVLFVKHNDNSLNIYNEVNSIGVPDKYDDNSYGNNVLYVNISTTPMVINDASRSTAILAAIREQRVANKMIAAIFKD
jgi:hypothetical protein